MPLRPGKRGARGVRYSGSLKRASTSSRIAARAFEDASHRTNPRPCSQEDLLAMLKAAY